MVFQGAQEHRLRQSYRVRRASFGRSLIKEVGRIGEIVRYPVKSMMGIVTESAMLGWHGLEGDRRFAFRRMEEKGGFPWLSASRLPELLLYEPIGHDVAGGEFLPTHVRTPSGALVEIWGLELKKEIAGRLGSDVELMKLKHGTFDEGAVSVINGATISEIGREAGIELDRRRFRSNIIVETTEGKPFLEDGWIGGMLLFGEGDERPAMSVLSKDERCMMINLDPETAVQEPRILKAVVRLNKNNAGVYATVVRRGTIRVSDTVYLQEDTPHG